MSDKDTRKMFMRNLHYYLRLSRKTQAEAAKAIHVSQQTFNTWYKGIAVPRPDKMDRLAKLFHVEVSDLLKEPEFENRIRNINYNDGNTDFLFKDYDGKELHVVVIDNEKKNPIMQKISDVAGVFKDKDTYSAPSLEESLFQQLSKEESNLINLYRSGKYKEIVSLMIDKMTEGS